MAVGFLSRVPAKRDTAAPGAEVYAFGSFVLDVARHTVTRDGHPVTLTPKTFELLLILVRSGGRVVSRQELVGALWPDTFVEEGNLSFQMSALRKALGGASADGSGNSSTSEAWVETVPKIGYRFRTDVTTPGGDLGHARRRTSAATLTAVAAVVAVLVVGALVVGGVRSGPVAPPSSYGTTAVPLTSYPGSEASPSLSPDGTQVAFHWNRPGRDNFDVYVKLVGDGEPMQVTNDPRPDVFPTWSPDGRRLGFLRASWDGTPWHLIVMPSLGGTERLVASLIPNLFADDSRGTTLLSWTPDGQWVAVGGRIDGEAGIWLVEVDGPRRVRLTKQPPRRTDRSPAVSSDGTRVAFIRWGPMSRAALHIVPLRPDFSPADPPREMLDPWPRQVGSVAWGADQASLLYAVGGHMGMSRLERLRLGSDRLSPAGVAEPLPFGDQATGLAVAASGRLVYVRRLRDAGFWSLDLEHPGRGVTAFPAVDSSLDEHTPHLSPDGRRLVFASTRSGTEEIWIANIDGSRPRQMTSMGGPLCANPQWSPDGQLVVFNSASAGSSDVYLLDPATARVTRLTADPGWEDQPRWSRDGQWIYFAARAEDQALTEIWRISRDGGEPAQVTRGGGVTGEESYDGRSLYFTRPTPPAAALFRMPLDGGEEVKLAHDVAGSLGFVVGRQAVYVRAMRLPFTTTSIDAIDIATGQRTTLASFDKRPWYGMTLSPDERLLLLSVVNDENLDLMLVDPPS